MTEVNNIERSIEKCLECCLIPEAGVGHKWVVGQGAKLSVQDGFFVRIGVDNVPTLSEITLF